MSDDQKTANEQKLEAAQAEVAEKNKALTGKGLRHAAGMTRGKNPQVIQWKRFDEENIESLPTSLAEFASLSGVTDEKKFLEFVIAGFNDEQYRLASDELNEYIESSWPNEKVQQFRLAVRNAAKLSGKSIEEVVKIIKPLMA